MLQPWLPQSKMVLGTSLHEFNPGKVHLFVANPSRRWKNSTNWGGKSIFPRCWAYQYFGDQMPPCRETCGPQDSAARLARGAVAFLLADLARREKDHLAGWHRRHLSHHPF